MNASLQCQTTRLVPGPSPWNVRIQDFMDENNPALDTHFIEEMVEPDGIEPTTSCLQSTRSPN